MSEPRQKISPIEKRDHSLRMYLRVNLIVFAIAFVLMAVYQAGVSFMYGPTIAVILVLSLGILALFPMIIYWINLTIQARNEFDAEEDIPTKARPKDRITYGPWAADLVLLAIFPPLGLCFAVKKLYAEKEHFLENAFMVRAIGLTIMVFSALFAIFNLAIGMPRSLALLGAAAFLIGIVSVYTAGLFEKQGRLVYKCRKMIYIDHTLNIEVCAAPLGFSYAKMIRVLQRMIDEELLPSCFIDFRNREIAAPVDLPKGSCKCPVCGGTTIYIKGYPVICDHCGRRLR